MQKGDKVKYTNNIIGEVTKVYIEEKTGIEKVQILTEQGFIFGIADDFVLLDEMLLRCNFCGIEEYESKLAVNIDNQMYMCRCGSSTFTPLNIDFEDEEIYNY